MSQPTTTFKIHTSIRVLADFRRQHVHLTYSCRLPGSYRICGPDAPKIHIPLQRQSHHARRRHNRQHSPGKQSHPAHLGRYILGPKVQRFVGFALPHRLPPKPCNSANSRPCSGTVGQGFDWGLTDAKGTFSPDAIYTLHTKDGATIMVTEKGHAPNVQILFETGDDRYAWLNPVVGYATGAPFEGGVSLDVWQLGG